MSARAEAQTPDAGRAGRMEMVGRFAAGIAHDFNNLLMVVQAAAESIAERPGTDPATLEEVEQIQAASRRGAALVRQMLVFARDAPAPAGRLDLRQAVADLAPLLGHLAGRAVRVEVEGGPDTLPVRIDPTGFDQVVLNLAANARDAMPEGGLLAVTCRRMERQGAAFAAIEVRDTGAGIPPQVLPRIFEPFFTTRQECGTGLGLATVNDIVRAAGGSVAVESAPGRGTLMRIALPLDVPPLAAAPLAAMPCVAEPPGALLPGTLLLVEDDRVVRRLAAHALEGWGWQVLGADSAEAALDCAEPGRLAGVVTDMDLPGASGVALLAALRARPGGAGLPAVIVSGHAEAALARDPAIRALLDKAAPATALLSKPYALSDLRACLGRIAPPGSHPPGTP